MKVTNKMGLPEALVKAVTIDRHNKEGEYSATTLLKDPAEVMLMKRHFDEIEVDAADSIWAVFGSAVHYIFEKQNDNAFKEERFEVPVLNSKVTGRVDNYDMENEILADFKTASIWKVTYNDFGDWRKQGLVYAYLMKKSGLNVKKCRFIALLKDHSKSKAKIDSSYPQSPVYVYEFDVTDKDLEEIEKFIFNKVADFEKAEKIPDEELPACSKEARWATDDKFAVMKTGRKTAIKLFDNREEAEKNMAALGGTYIEERKGESRKCLDYCSACEFCPFYKTLSKN